MARAAPATDYVLIGRRAALARSYAALRQDLQRAMRRVGASLDEVGQAKP